jgi:1-acyl-sn-glycerol-3-phosphate acyltransferase
MSIHRMLRSRPSPEVLRALSPMERIALEIGHLSTKHLSLPAKAYNTVTMGIMLWATAGKRMDIVGLEHVARFGKKDRVLYVCNHRSFFDFFVITAVTFWRTRLSRRILFPVRSTFFYDHPLGPMVNGAMSAMTMFPPLLRDKGEDKRAFNKWAIERCIEELHVPGTVMGLHPEGTRNKTDDPYALLSAKPGVGRVALGAAGAHVIPCFVLGPGNDLAAEFGRNWRAPQDNRIDVLFGPELDFSDLRAKDEGNSTALAASQRCLEAIRALSVEQRKLRGIPVVKSSTQLQSNEE